jgi:hypothetical protein
MLVAAGSVQHLPIPASNNLAQSIINKRLPIRSSFRLSPWRGMPQSSALLRTSYVAGDGNRLGDGGSLGRGRDRKGIPSPAGMTGFGVWEGLAPRPLVLRYNMA